MTIAEGTARFRGDPVRGPVSAPTATALPQRRVERCMGTVFSIDVRAPGVAGGALDAVFGWLHRVDAAFSTYRADSEISRLARGELPRAAASADVLHVLDRCDQLAAETGGWFSATAGGRLDPSGFVKGWAIETASEVLRLAGSRNHCVNGGGDVQCAGSAGPGRPWTVGIADPRRRGALLASVSGVDLAVATSGTAERGAHILDPGTGAAAGVDLLSVTVVGHRLGTVDAYATAAFAMGADAARSWLLSRPEVISALLVHADGHAEPVQALPRTA